MEDTSSRKRPRPVVSCLRCREKKLKCDRASPCQNCVKGHCPNDCAYAQFPPPGSSTTAGSKPKRDGVSQASITPPEPGPIEDLQQRVAKLEEILIFRPASSYEAMQSPAPSNGTNQSTASAPSHQFLGTLVVKGSRSRYHGQNDRETLLNQFVEAKSFIGNMSKNSQLMALARQVQFLQGKSQSKIASPAAGSDSDFSLALLKLREFLPPKSTCDRLVQIYCRYFERSERVLHIPTFLQQYKSIWANSDPELCKSSCTIPLVTGALAMAYSMDDSTPPDEDTSHRSYLKSAAIDFTQAWLDELGRKQRGELSTLQVEILLLLARTLRQELPERLWSATGSLVRSAMVMGLHMDPASVPKISPFQAEMRRRLWTTIMEMDLQASMGVGQPVSAPDIDFAPLLPTNIDDSEFDEHSTALPEPKPLSVMTDTLFQVYLASCLPQRVKAVSLLQGAPIKIDLAKAVKHGRRVEEFLWRKPPVLALGSAIPSSNDPGGLLHKILVDLFLRRPLLSLYRPLLLADHQDHPLFPEIHKSCLESSLAILSYQSHYDSGLMDDLDSGRSHQNFFYMCCKNDVLWAALSICQHVKMLRSVATVRQPGENNLDETTLFDTVDRTVERLVDRIGQRGSDVKDIILLTVALRSAQIGAAQNRESYIRQETEKTLATCRERLMQTVVLGEQKHPGSSVKRAKTMSQGGLHEPSTIPLRTPSPSQQPVNTSMPPNASSIPLQDGFQYGSHLQQDQGKLFADLPDLAAEFDNYQGDMFGFGDDFNFDLDHSNWNWNSTWQ
ncbi:hypothetical protein GQ43DRAFT_378261 [Delitschia confertaspora ATCC 74209]|uniref:Zn(2)-C6 fungal-type domain-containing protein n=1 Tax=Delitschia confertaspora ATCC 74209 TaxID=1513339 RepID=A0A9P4JGB2_9PLEO|nr:hypothetical protein GQ43DRAFT_378261 [Delitschia confertaspora ATCC 74209]